MSVRNFARGEEFAERGRGRGERGMIVRAENTRVTSRRRKPESPMKHVS